MERLELFEAPDDIEKYGPNDLVRRKKNYSANMSYEDWKNFFAKREFSIRWVVPWWRLTRMVGTNDTPYCRVPSISKLTFYCPSRLMRQYGLEQVVPRYNDSPREVSLHESNVHKYETYWIGRPLWTVSASDQAPPPLSSAYKAWLNPRSRRERFGSRKSDVKSRLGNKKAPPKDRLGPRTQGIEFKTPIMPRKKNYVKGKGKEKMVYREKQPKKFKKGERGESSTRGVTVRATKDTLMVKADLIDQEKDVPKEKRD